MRDQIFEQFQHFRLECAFLADSVQSDASVPAFIIKEINSAEVEDIGKAGKHSLKHNWDIYPVIKLEHVYRLARRLLTHDFQAWIDRPHWRVKQVHKELGQAVSMQIAKLLYFGVMDDQNR